MRIWAYLDWNTSESLEVWGNWILLYDKVTTMNLLFVAITNNLFMHVLPGGKLFFYGCLTEVPAAIQQEERTAGLQEFVFLRGREAVRPPDRDTCPVLGHIFRKCRRHSTNSQLLSQNYQLYRRWSQKESGRTENIQQLPIITSIKWCRRCIGQADS